MVANEYKISHFSIALKCFSIILYLLIITLLMALLNESLEAIEKIMRNRSELG